MDKYRKLAEVMKASAGVVTAKLLAATVVKVDGEKCTVKWGQAELTDVRLKATINGKKSKILVTPVVGSYVLVGSLTGDEKDLCVLSVDQAAKVEYVNNGLDLLADSADEKVRIKNSTYDLLTLVHELIDACINEIHMTNAGPSVSLNPISRFTFERLKQKFSQLLKK